MATASIMGATTTVPRQKSANRAAIGSSASKKCCNVLEMNVKVTALVDVRPLWVKRENGNREKSGDLTTSQEKMKHQIEKWRLMTGSDSLLNSFDPKQFRD